MSTPLRDLITAVAFDEPSHAAFAADPARFLDEHGWSGLDGADVAAALGALVHELPIDQADALHTVVAGQDGFAEDTGGAIAGLTAAAGALGSVADRPLEDSDPARGLDDADDDPARLLDDEIETEAEIDDVGGDDDDDVDELDDLDEIGDLDELDVEESDSDASESVGAFDPPDPFDAAYSLDSDDSAGLLASDPLAELDADLDTEDGSSEGVDDLDHDAHGPIDDPGFED